MEQLFINEISDKKLFLNTSGAFLNSVLAENNLKQFCQMSEFFQSEKFLMLVNGFLGTGKSSVVDYFLRFLKTEVITLKYNCYETTILEDLLLSFFEKFKELAAENIIQEPKMRSENFVQKINSYFISITSPVVIVLDSFEEVLKNNKPEILGFLKHLSQTGRVKVVIISRKFDYEDFENVFDYTKISIGALEKHLFEKYLKSSDIKLIGPVSDELYKHTRGYFLYTALAVKIIKIRGLSLYEFIGGFSKSFLSFNDFILREALALVDPVSGHLFRFLTVVRHPVSVKLLKAFNLFDEIKIKIFIEAMILSKDENMIYLKDYYKSIAENSIPDNVAVKLHRSCVELYNTQLPLKPMERDLLISRATMRSEIEYHSMFLPKKPVIKPKHVLEPAEPLKVEEPLEIPPKKDISSISFIFESEEEEVSIMNKIADSINEFITFTDEQLKEIEKENNMSILELVNRARQEENNFNFKRVVMIYQRCLMMKNDSDFQTFQPIVYTKLAGAYAKLSDWFNSLKYYEEAAKIYSSAGDILKLSEIKFEIANIYYMMFKRENAKDVLTEIVSLKNLQPDSYIKSYILLADLSDDDVDKAYENLKSALEYSENSENESLLAELYYKFAIASDEKGETKQAVMFYKNCVEIQKEKNPFISSAYSNLAAIYEDADAKDSAIKFYELSLAIDEENNNLNGIYLSSMKLASLNRRKNPETAFKFYNRAYETACKLNEVFYKVSSTLALGDFYLSSKNPEVALKKYLHAKATAEGNLSEKNLNKIERRIEDLKIQLGEEKFNEIKDGKFNEIQ